MTFYDFGNEAKAWFMLAFLFVINCPDCQDILSRLSVYTFGSGYCPSLKVLADGPTTAAGTVTNGQVQENLRDGV